MTPILSESSPLTGGILALSSNHPGETTSLEYRAYLEELYSCRIRNSPRFGLRYWLRDTTPRTFILAHPGNTIKHTLGCLLPGLKIGFINGRRAVLLSRRATRELEEHMGHEIFELEIR